METILWLLPWIQWDRVLLVVVVLVAIGIALALGHTKKGPEQ